MQINPIPNDNILDLPELKAAICRRQNECRFNDDLCL